VYSYGVEDEDVSEGIEGLRGTPQEGGEEKTVATMSKFKGNEEQCGISRISQFV
jgi:hypothetical protein